MADFDQWLTTDLDDMPTCEEHGRSILCDLCEYEECERREDGKREERGCRKWTRNWGK